MEARTMNPENASKAPTGRQIAMLERIAYKTGADLRVRVELGPMTHPLTRAAASEIIDAAFADGTLTRRDG